MSLTIDLDLPADLDRLRLPAAVASRLQSLLDRQDAGHPLTADERAEAEGLADLADLLTLLKDSQENEEGLIDVVICDQFVDGAALDAVQKQHPEIKILMASTSDSAPRGVNVIRKPVRPADMRKRLKLA